MARRVDIAEAITLFLEEKRAAKKPRTVIAYEQTLRQAQELLRRVGVTKVHTIQPHHLRQIIGATVGWKKPDPITGRVITDGTLNNHIQRLKVFMAWCQELRYVTENPARQIERIKLTPTKKKYLSKDECERILGAARHPRDRALFAVCVYAAIRVGEALLLKIDDIDFGKQELSLVEEKTSRRHVKDISEELLVELSSWLLMYERLLGGPLSGDMYLIPRIERPSFVGDRKVNGVEDRAPEPYAPYKGGFTALNKVLTDLDLKAPNQAFHMFRRSTGRLVYDYLCEDDRSSDKALRMVQQFYGHSTRAVTENYLGLAAEAEELSRLIKGKPLFPKPPAAGELPENVIRMHREEETG